MKFILKFMLGLIYCLGILTTIGKEIKVACVGDSITFGAGIKNRNINSYPAQLGKMLGEKYTVKNFGISGSTVLKKGNKPYWKQTAYKKALNSSPNIVIIKLGTNDIKTMNWKYSKEFISNYVEMIKSFQNLSSKPTVYICYPVPAYQIKWTINNTTIVNEVIPQIDIISKKTGTKIIDLYKELSNKEILFPDKIHPNKEGAKIMAKTIVKTIKAKCTINKFPGKLSKWHGFDMYTDGSSKIVVPKKIADGKPWVWRARFFGHEPQFDIAMLNNGYHVAYCSVTSLYGNKEAVEKWDKFYNYLKSEHLFSSKVVLEGFSRGGLIIYNWAIKNPDKVAAIYADAPVMNLNSWPNNRYPSNKKEMMQAYGFKNDKNIANYRLNPIDTLEILAKYKVPIIHVVGDIDKVVPLKDNTAIAEQRYKKVGGMFKVIHKAKVGHHPHSLKDPQPIVDFIIKHTTQPIK